MNAPATSTPAISAQQVREQFLAFFRDRAHTLVPSSPVVPHNDPTLLFANAGMNQFKPVFLADIPAGSPLQGLTRATNTQKCIRAGGKHNDLDDVGKDTYHHTFFEMLGNWSFGDYFKPQAIDWAWQLLVEQWGLEPERLHATYFEGDPAEGLEPDHEARELWLKHLPPERVHPGNKKDNFWEMGDTGPCGPCSEIHFDRSQNKSGASLVNADKQDTVVEIWNLVFIQYNREPAGLMPLPKQHVDTGMGFERIVRVLQRKDSNYDTDVFAPLFDTIQRVTSARPYQPGGHEAALKDPVNIAYRVCADHVRTLSFAIADGALPSNEGRGYVLRSVLRRAARYGTQTFNMSEPWLGTIAETLAEQMASTFPELENALPQIKDVLEDEERSFGKTIKQGIAYFELACIESFTRANRNPDHLPEAARLSITRFAGRPALRIQYGPELSAEIYTVDQFMTRESIPWLYFRGVPIIRSVAAFQLHDTYGFPIDLTRQMAEERGLTVDIEGFNHLMDQARERSRAGGSATDELAPLILPQSALAGLKTLAVKPTNDQPKFAGHLARATIKAIWNGTDFDQHTTTTTKNTAGRVTLILDKTNFYAEMGGQLADQGTIRTDEGDEFAVEHVKAVAGFVLHIGRVTRGHIRVGEACELRRDEDRRTDIAANHTATHLLNHALRDVLGDAVEQKGSLVAQGRLRFDFAHHAALTTSEAADIESRVRDAINADHQVFAEAAPLEAARTIVGLRAVFGETYPDPVRVVSIGAPINDLLADPHNDTWRAHAVEFCGGTHLAHTADAQAFAITAEESVSKGVRRIQALTRGPAQAAIKEGERLAEVVHGLSAAKPQDLPNVVPQLMAEVDAAEIPLPVKTDLRAHLAELHKRAKAASKQAAAAGAKDAAAAARTIADQATGEFIVAEIPAGADRPALMAAMDTVRANASQTAALLISADHDSGKLTIVAKVPDTLIARGLKAGDWVRATAQACDGKGGGKPDSAQGGGTDIEKLPNAIEAARLHAQGALS